MSFDWKKTLATVAPTVATALGGPMAGVAVKLATDALGIEPDQKALEQAVLSGDPNILLKLKEAENSFVLEMKKLDYQDKQSEHIETQNTIREGDKASDEYVRHTRPKMARQSWFGTIAYCLGCWVYSAFSNGDIFNMYIAGFISAPAWAYIGFRTGDKFADALGKARAAK